MTYHIDLHSLSHLSFNHKLSNYQFNSPLKYPIFLYVPSLYIHDCIHFGMFLVGFGFNKILFLIILASDISLIVACYFTDTLSIWLLGLLVVVMIFFKYQHWRMSYSIISKRIIILTFVSVIISILFEVWMNLNTFRLCMMFRYISAIPGIIIGILSIIMLPIKAIMIANLYLMNKVVKWGMEIPVDMFDGTFNKIDKMAEYIPFE